MSIQENILILRKEIPPHVKVVAISKTKSVLEIMEAYEAGQKVFGENKAQELHSKYPLLPPDIQWHFVGHLQTNKVRFIAPYVALIHSIDSLKLLQEVDKEAQKNNRVIDCLLQFHIASEESKFGLDLEEAKLLLNAGSCQKMNHIRIIGIMGIATFSCNPDLIRNEFRTLKGSFDLLKNDYFRGKDEFCELSMGMSGDYQIAIEEGSTIVRIGTAIFGERTYL